MATSCVSRSAVTQKSLFTHHDVFLTDFLASVLKSLRFFCKDISDALYISETPCNFPFLKTKQPSSHDDIHVHINPVETFA